MGNVDSNWHPATPGLFISSHQPHPPPPPPPQQQPQPQHQRFMPPHHHHHPHHRGGTGGVHQRQNTYDNLVGLLTSRSNHHHMSTWLNNNNVTLGASQSTIESTTFAHKYSKPKSSTSGAKVVKTEEAESQQEEAETGMEESKISSDRTVDDKCTICLCEYEEDEDVR